MPCQCGYPDGMSTRGRMVFLRAESEGKSSSLRGDIPSGYPHWHGIFVLLYRTNQQWLPVDPVRTVDVLPVDILPVDMEWPTFVSQSQLTIFKWGITKYNIKSRMNFILLLQNKSKTYEIQCHHSPVVLKHGPFLVPLGMQMWGGHVMLEKYFHEQDFHIFGLSCHTLSNL